MELYITIPFMLSDSYQDRFKAEYYQLNIRINKLTELLECWDKGELKFEPICPRSFYDLQLDAMNRYKSILEARAVMEHIDI